MDREALHALYVRLEKPLYNAVYRWVWNSEEAAEVVQEGFVRLWGMRDRVDMSTVEPLIWRITLNQAAKRHRSRKRWQTLPWMDRAGVAEEDPLVRQDVRDAVEALPEELRQVVLLCSFSGMSYAEVGEVLGIPEGTVGSRKNRAMTCLKESLQ